MNNLWTISIEDYLTIMEEAIVLGKERGKQPGENIEDEFFEIAKKKNKMPKHLGQTKIDKDLIIGNLREEGFKIFNPDEEQRRNR